MASETQCEAPEALQLAPGFPPERLRPYFARAGRLHVPDVLEPNAAARLSAALGSEVRYNRVVNQGTKSWDVPLDQFSALPTETQVGLEQAALEAARHGFQYFYDSYRLSDEVEAGRSPGGLLEAAYRFLNGADFLDWVQEVTGDRRPRLADAQVTRYGPGHFLTTHDDENQAKGRLYAYVLNLTPTAWRADWGGLLLFLDEDGHVAEGFTPAFNALNLFRVPQRHCVSLVAPFAPPSRLSITGWLRA